jgi:hypothetical protein
MPRINLMLSIDPCEVEIFVRYKGLDRNTRINPSFLLSF